MHLLVRGAFWRHMANAPLSCVEVLMHLLVLGTFWPCLRGGVVAPLPGAGAPPAPQAPRGTGQQCPNLTTFRRPDAKRHRRPFGNPQLPASDEVKPKDQRSDL